MIFGVEMAVLNFWPCLCSIYLKGEIWDNYLEHPCTE